MKQPQRLQLLQRSTRTKPAIYRLGANETLCLYRDQSQTVEICDLKGHHIRTLDAHQLRDWGYNPAKLIDNNIDDQFLDDTSIPITRKVAKATKMTGLAMLMGLAVGFISNITGCTEYVLKQADKDIATTTIAPVENYQRQIEFKQTQDHANEFLSKHYSKVGR